MQQMKALFVTVTIVMVATMIAAVTAQHAGTAAALFEAARQKETVEGDLAGAIKQYQALVDRFAKADRGVVASALVRMASCYEKLGHSQSTAIYERVVREYADQKHAVTLALVRLKRTEAAATPANMATRRLWMGSDISYLSPVSRDGQNLTFQDGDTGDLAIRNLGTGEKHRLTNKGSWADSYDVAATSVISRDGRQVAYVWFDHQESAYELRILPIGTRPGAKSQIVYGRRSGVQRVSPFDWLPDGKAILAIVTNEDKTNQIAMVGVPHGSLRVIKSLGWRYPWRPSLSPDGRSIAYNFQPREDSQQRDVFLLASDGSREVAVTRHPADDYLLGWTPDGSSILFASDRTGTIDIWAVGVTNGKPHGSAELIRKNVGNLLPMGISEKGSLYYQVQGGNGDLYTVNLNALQPGGAAEAVTERFAGTNVGASWSPNGKYLAYASQRGLRGQVAPIICIRSIADGGERELSPGLVYVDGYSGVRWTSDGRYVVVAGQDSKGRQGLYKIDVQSADVTPLAHDDTGTQGLARAELSPDAKMLFYRRAKFNSKTSHIVARIVESGDEQEIVAVPNTTWPHVALSPDGRRLAFGYTDLEAKSTHLVVLSIETGQTLEVARSNTENAKEDWTIYPPAALLWTPDGRRLIIGRPDGSLWSISSEGADRQHLGAPAKNLLNARMHPNGQQIVFTVNSQSPETEIWVMENFLPLTAKK